METLGKSTRKKARHYRLLIKKNAIARLKAGEVTITELCEELDINRHTVRYWTEQIDHWADTDTGIKLRRTFPESFKRKFVMQVEAGELTLNEACIKYNYKWVRNTKPWFEKYGSANLQENSTTSVSKKSGISSKPLDLPDIHHEKELEERLRNAHLKIALLETMIDVAEKQLNIDIRKKAGAKQ